MSTAVAERPVESVAAENQEQIARRLEARMADAIARLNEAHADVVAIATEARDTGSWAGPGLRSLAHWLAWQAGVSAATAHQLVRVVRERATHPLLSRCFERGELTLDQFAAAVRAPAHCDAEFASLAPRCTVGQIHTMVRAATPPPEVTDPERPAEHVTVSHLDDGAGDVRARLEADNLAIVEAALAAARDRLFRDGQTDVTWVDALVDVCQRSLDQECGSRQDRFRIAIFLDPNAPVRARWANGTAVPDAIRRFVTCDGRLTPVFTDGAKPVSVGRSHRIVPDRTRREVLRRDGRCRAPWCDRVHGLEIHHRVHWEDGGRSDTCDLVALCTSCHRRHHLGEFEIHGDADRPDGLTFTDRRGRPIVRPSPCRAGGPAPPPPRPYRHPLGERLDASLLWFPPPPDPT